MSRELVAVRTGTWYPFQVFAMSGQRTLYRNPKKRTCCRGHDDVIDGSGTNLAFADLPG